MFQVEMRKLIKQHEEKEKTGVAEKVREYFFLF